jgi:RNA polymerase sigma factor (sigma-70 family)
MLLSQLVKEAKLGRASAQKTLFDSLAGRMMIVCRRYVKNKEDAEEILLDGFYKFFKHLHSFNYVNEAALNAWIKTIIINECLMFLRKKNVFTMIAESDGGEVGLEEDALNNLSAEEILKLIMQLPVGYRTVFNLHVVEGMPHKEIADLLGITEGTSKSQLSKAKSVLQKLLVNRVDINIPKTSKNVLER